MKKKIIIGSAIAVVIVAFIAVNILRNTGSAAVFGGGKAIDVSVEKVTKGSISASVSASGNIEESDKAQVYFDTPLKVNKLLVKKNQKVKKGDKLVELDMDSLNSQLEQERVNKALIEIKTPESTRNAAETALNNVKSAQNAYDNAESTFDKQKMLYESGAISKSDFDASLKALNDADIALQNAKLSYSSAADAQNTDSASQEQNLRAENLKISDLETKIRKINELTVSPIDGVMTEMNLEEGGFTSNAQLAFKIVNMDKLKVRADVKEFDIKNVAVGQDVKITGDAISKDDTVTGKVTEISTIAKTNKTASGDETLVEVVISIDNVIPILKPGLTTTCYITTKVNDSAVLVSFEALTDDKDGNKLAYVVDSSNIAHQRKLKLGITSDLNAEVTEGLKEGEKVVINPPLTLKDGSKVKITDTVKK